MDAQVEQLVVADASMDLSQGSIEVEQERRVRIIRRIDWIKGEPIRYVWLSVGLPSD